jgi:crotonobetainyl-CoA:carnitine CoA-transferase CaiB-like acyl-CoA transferase
MSPLVHMLLVAMTRDGHWLQFAAAAPHLFAALLKALGLEWMLTDPAWKGIPVFEDGERRLALFEAMQASVAERTLAEWESVFASSPDVFAEVYRAGPDVLEHPQLVHDGYPVTIDDPERGPVRQPGAPFLINGRPPTLRASPSSVQDVWCTADTTSQQGPPHHDPETSSGRFPLEGVTILEFAVLFAAPYAATLLTDLGARVIKVEPLTGDPIRTILPFPEMGGAKAMQGKESICVDLTTAEGREIVHRLARRADVVLQGFRAGVAERLGIDSRTLRSINPDLVYVNATGYGDDGPCADRPAFAPSIGAASGIALANVGSTVREESGLDTARRRESAIRLSASCTIAHAQADGFAALGAATAILAGLLARARTGAAPVVSSSMLATCTHAMVEHVVDYDGAPLPPDPGDGMWGPDPFYRIYPAASGWVFLAAPHSEDWTALVKALAPWSDLASDERFESADSRQRNADELAEALGRIFATRDAAAWERDLLAADVACVQVTTDRIERVLKGEVGQTSGYVVEVTHPTFDRHPRLAPPVRFSRSSTRALPGVLAGSATDEVLTELGYATADIADLRSRRVVR